MTGWGEGEVSAESIGQTAFLGLRGPRDAKPTHPGAAGGHRGPKLAKLGQNLADGGRLVYMRSSQNGNSGIEPGLSLKNHLAGPGSTDDGGFHQATTPSP
jgi:hypothetical protein